MPNKQVNKKLLVSSEFITRNIHDIATRIVVEKIVKERDMLRNEVNILKSQTKIVIDRRVNKNLNEYNISNIDEITVAVSPSLNLNPIEREALEHSISPDLWINEGWQEEKLGRVVKKINSHRSRTIFKPGFVSAIKKILNTK